MSTVKVPNFRHFPVFQAFGPNLPNRCAIGWIIFCEDDDLFPSNRFKDEIENNDFEGVSLLECMALSQWCGGGTGVLLER